jgi:hypothetical protein
MLLTAGVLFSKWLLYSVSLDNLLALKWKKNYNGLSGVE